MNLDIKATGIPNGNNLRIYFYSISMDYISVFMSGPHCFDYGSFLLSFEIRKPCSPFQVCSSFLRLL